MTFAFCKEASKSRKVTCSCPCPTSYWKGESHSPEGQLPVSESAGSWRRGLTEVGLDHRFVLGKHHPTPQWEVLGLYLLAQAHLSASTLTEARRCGSSNRSTCIGQQSLLLLLLHSVGSCPAFLTSPWHWSPCLSLGFDDLPSSASCSQDT